MADSEEFVKRHTAQKRTFELINNFMTNTRKAKAEDTYTAEDYVVRLELLTSYFSEFQAGDSFLAAYETKERERSYFRLGLYQKGTLAFLEAKAELNKRINALRGNVSASSNPSGQLIVQPNAAMSRQSQLERIKLPKFSGKQRDWESFKEKFTSLVLSDPDMDKVFKFNRLIDALEGDAAARISGFEPIARNFDSAWESLITRYDNKFLRFAVHMQALSQLPRSDKEDASHINRLINTTNESINAFRSLGLPIEFWDVIFIHFIESKLASQTRMDWVKELERLKSQTFPKFAEFKRFLDDRVQTLELMSSETSSDTAAPRSENNKKFTTAGSSKSQKTASVHFTTQKSGKPTHKAKCSFCSGNHFIGYCKAFASSLQVQRMAHAVSAKLCLNCLSAAHGTETCPSKVRCFVCQDKHHTKLHQDTSEKPTPRTNSAVAAGGVQNFCCNISRLDTVSKFSNVTHSNRLLATVRVIIESEEGQSITVRALLDNCAEETIIPEFLVQALSLRKQPSHTVVSGVEGKGGVVARSQTEFRVKSIYDPTFVLKVPALVLPTLSSVLPHSEIKRQAWPHLKGVQLADPEFGIPGRVDCILNSTVYGAVILPEIRRNTSSLDQPVAQRTQLGWILVGKAGSSTSLREAKVAAQLATPAQPVESDSDLTKALARFWETEEVPVLSSWSPLEQECYAHFQQTHSRNTEGRFVVRLPFKQKMDFPESRTVAAACLSRLERRFARQPELATPYKGFMQEYLELNHMRVVPADEVKKSNICYLPHHPVFKNDGSKKIRVVFNASQKFLSGVSLNSIMHVGPKLQEDLVVIILRWGFFRYVFTCDIVKMFRQFLVHSDDVDWQRILWYDNDRVSSFQLLTVTYGTGSAPFLSNACMLQLADDDAEVHPIAARIIRKNRYADDFFAGGDDLQEALQARDQLISCLESAGMQVDKWATNSENLLNKLSLGNSMVQERELSQAEVVSTLGLHWIPTKDIFSFRVRLPEKPPKITKRTILSEVAKLFDPIGWISPVVVRAKMLLQKLWLLGAGWDEPVPIDLQNLWLGFRDQLQEIEQIQIPRWNGSTKSSCWQLHGFCDESEKAYAAVLYIVVEIDGHILSNILMAKSKIAPIKVVSLPKLELCGATLLARLISFILPNLDCKPSQICCWSDAKVVLAWLQSHPSRWKPYVANRVSEIVTSVPEATWRHVRSADNPADLSSRGCSPSQLRESTIWWSGPAWLSKPFDEWPIDNHLTFSTDLESRKGDDRQVWLVQEKSDISVWCEKFSSFDKLISILAYVYRWRSLAKSNKRSVKNYLTAAEITVGQVALLRLVQREAFEKELSEIEAKGRVSESSHIRRLAPFVGQDGLLRVGGRIQSSLLSESEKHPIILPKTHHVTTLIIRKAHVVTLHGGPLLVMSTLLRQFWIVHARNVIRTIVRKCVRCARFNANTQQQLMGPLPACRTRPSRPFSITGVDYAGPF